MRARAQGADMTRRKIPPVRSCTTALDTLKAARAWFRQGAQTWCQGDYAIDRHGHALVSAWEEAQACCVAGSLIRFGASQFVVGEAALYIKKAIKKNVLARWNDDPDRTYSEVLAAVERAVQLAEKDTAP
jgi:hypothetical protein